MLIVLTSSQTLMTSASYSLLPNNNIMEIRGTVNAFYAFFTIEKQDILADILLKVHLLIIFTFSSSFRFFLTSYAWLLVVFPFADLLLNASFSTVSFESA